eukprot:TRINITY_DN1332_c0_g1_i3.p1 TRINITY_DN1332_c0_g1~~TRINITY_DN1332_c0_g1_i3.p1  ORF type:complete len:602 (+),score=90.45 TRINITY_DN1332_c0_g1_i3:282-2087(+)
MGDATQLTATSVTPFVDNRQTYVPHYYSKEDGYGSLAVVNSTSGSGKTNFLPAGYSTDGTLITWEYDPEQSFELYFFPAAQLDDGTSALYALTGAPAVPPRYAFGFLASRWGWANRSYIESVLHTFRAGNYPIDAIITDFGWFTNVSDYAFPPQGVPWYDDFGFADATFPDPQAQLADYHAAPLNFRMGGIRKPRLGNTALLQLAGSKGYLLPGGELKGELGYAEQRNLDFSKPETREWYSEQQQHYITDGVDFFWNDEGETDYFTFYWWNVAQELTLRKVSKNRRFFSINRAFTPGMARLGATTWTGDINPSWSDLASTPGMVLNWGLSGAPYTACDIGGFTSQSEALLLTRWMQLGTFMPVMRVHSTHSATPHFPWLWGEPFASIMRTALELRYRLMPYHYSLAHRMHTTGKLWMRPMVAEFGGDSAAAPLTSQWMDGALLVSPVLTEDSTKSVYLPEGSWFEFNTSSTITGPTNISATAELTEVPVYVRPGTVLPLAPIVQESNALPGGPLEVHVYTGADGWFDLVEDDGNSTAYLTGGVTVTSLAWVDASRTLSWSVVGAGKAANAFEQLFVTVFGPAGQHSSSVKPIGASGSIQMA